MNSVTITRRMNDVMEGFDESFGTLLCKDDLRRVIGELRFAAGYSNEPSVRTALYRMLDSFGLKYEQGKDADYYSTLVNNADIPETIDIEKTIITSLYEKFSYYPTPADYMSGIVRTLSTDNDWENDSVRLQILKQFIKYGNYLKDAGVGGRLYINNYVRETTGKRGKLNVQTVLEGIDEGVFGVLENASREQLRPDGIYGIIRISDDLANGNFLVGGTTRKHLYLFAMVFNMTYSLKNSFSITKHGSDIEKNLFFDYYTNNLTRYMNSMYRENITRYEINPSGRGINYKNFVEMVYLYYIAKDIPPADKIKKSEEMIKRIREKCAHCGDARHIETDRTAYYQNLYSEDILSKNDEDFEDFICRNYNCDTYTDGTPQAAIQLEIEQHSAFAEYQRLCKMFDEIRDSNGQKDYGLWFSDVSGFDKLDFKQRFSQLMNDGNSEKADCFLALLRGADYFLKSKWFELTDKSKMNRTYLLCAFYYYLNERSASNASAGNALTFREFYSIFKAEADEYLEKAGYQLISYKNIFDMLIIISAYSYMFF